MKFKNILRVHRTMKHEERNMALEHLKIHRRTLHEYRFWRNRTCIDEIYQKMENLFPPLKTKLLHCYCLFSYMLQLETKITKLRNKTSYTKVTNVLFSLKTSLAVGHPFFCSFLCAFQIQQLALSF